MNQDTVSITASEAAELVHYIASLRAKLICERLDHPWPGPTVYEVLRRLDEANGKRRGTPGGRSGLRPDGAGTSNHRPRRSTLQVAP